MEKDFNEDKDYLQSLSLYGSIRVDNSRSQISVQNKAKGEGGSLKWYKKKTLLVSSALFGLSIFLLSVSFSGVNVPSLSQRERLVKKVESLNGESYNIPFPHVDRSIYNIPANKIIDTSLFHHSLRNDIDEISYETITDLEMGKRLLKVPLPTGAFWTNLILPQYSGGTDESFPIMVYPYAYKWSSNGLVLSYPSLRRLMDEISIRDIFNPDIEFKTNETISSRYITDFDPLSVTLRFDMKQTDESTSNLRSERESFMETYIVQGSPWTTMRYVNSTPIIHALSIFTSVECGDDFDSTEPQCEIVPDTSTAPGLHPIKLKGKRFLIHADKDLIWVLVSSKEIVLTYDTIHRTTVFMSEPFDGVFRLTIIPPKQSNDFPLTQQFPNAYEKIDIKNSTGYQNLLSSSDLYPIGAKIDWEFPSSDDGKENSVAKLNFQYKVKSMREENSNISFETSNLLMLSLPHHTQILKTNILLNSTVFDLSYRTIKGFMTPVLGDCWYMEEQLTNTGLDSEETLLKVRGFDDTMREKILDQVKVDSIQVLPNTDENVYGFGKQVARLAQLAHITSTIGLTPSSESLLNDIKVSLHKYLADYLSGEIRDQLLYDENFGGIVSTDGLKNSHNDFGNGWYNDHHFHYGYILYACGILGSLNSTFISEYGSHIDALMHDVAYNKNTYPSELQEEGVSFLPFTRYKSWYDGHSYASGLFPFADGKSQESSTESINCYYGAYVWLLAKEHHANSDVKTNGELNFARLLLATEIRSVRLYWHMHASGNVKNVQGNPSIYNPIFAKNLMVGNSAMMDVTVATWFGNQPLYVHMINFMPVTALTKELFDKNYIKNEFETIISPLYNEVEMPWRGYVVCDRALSEPMTAWKDAQDLVSPELDQALSKSQVFYFIATLNDFDITGINININNGTIVDSYGCAANSKCHALGLTGLCCPAEVGGALLSCCDAYGTEPVDDVENISPKHSSTDNATALYNDKSNVTSSSAIKSDGNTSCKANSKCNALGLTGLCCPATEGGVLLSCCDAYGNELDNTEENGTSSPSASTPDSVVSASSSCEANSKCNALGLTGLCCPATEGGVLLSCCDAYGNELDNTEEKGTSSPSASTSDSVVSASSSCEANSKCNALGLTGLCCPATEGGVLLSCCDSYGTFEESNTIEKGNTLPGTVKSEKLDASSCEANPRCKALGLTGSCCPTTKDGNMLSCCSKKRLDIFGILAVLSLITILYSWSKNGKNFKKYRA